MQKPDTINSRTPEEIKRSLKCRAMWGTPDCKMKCDECGTYVPGLNGSIMAAAALAYIQQLEDRIRLLQAYDKGKLQKIVQLERERDAMFESLQRRRSCLDCTQYDEGMHKSNTVCQGCNFGSNWQWRGVQKEE